MKLDQLKEANYANPQDTMQFTSETNALFNAMQQYRTKMIQHSQQGTAGVTPEFVKQFENVRRQLFQITKLNKPEQISDTNYTVPR